MQYVIITFRQVIFSDASTSDFKSELIVRSLLHAFVEILMFFFEVLMRKVLTRCKIVLWYRFRQNENGKFLRCDFFALLPLKLILTSYVTRFNKKKTLNQIKFNLWFFGLETCKDDSYQQKNFPSRKFLKTMFLLLLKIPVTVEWFDHPLRTFAIKKKSI